MTRLLHVATHNIHKGFSHFNWRMSLHELRGKLRGLGVDIVFLQEVQGRHESHSWRYRDWPDAPQYEFLADAVWQDYAYGRNAVYDDGHHGNAVLSRYPILRWDNVDISAHHMERRGLLHCEVEVPGWDVPLHCVCVHLGLLARGRRLQLSLVRDHIERLVPSGAPLVVAGDFNDWRRDAALILAAPLALREVFENFGGHPARSFPAMLPIFRLDRIYVRGFRVVRSHVHHGLRWSRLSDHAVLTSTLARA
jgi:endonuclease/exonuclease/phosphatase family metal-dependent hydrolase